MILRDKTHRGIPGFGHVFIGAQVDSRRRADPFQRCIGSFLPFPPNPKDLLGAALLVIQHPCGSVRPIVRAACVWKCDGQNLRPMGDGAPFVSGFDTPELSRYSDCPKETHAGLLAAVRMSELLRKPGLVIEDSGEIDNFRRPPVVLRLPDGSTIGQTLINEGFERVWTPPYRASWCD